MRATRRTRHMVGAIAVSGALVGTAALVVAASSDPSETGAPAATVTSNNSRPHASDPPPIESGGSEPASSEVPAQATTAAPTPTPTPTPTSTATGWPEARPGEQGSAPDADADFVDEEPLDGVPGEISGPGEPSAPTPTQPVVMASAHLAAVPAPPSPQPPETPLPPIDLVVGDVTPPSPPPPGNTPVVVSDYQLNPDTGVNDIAGNATGCALECVSSAILTFNTSSPNVALEVEAKVPVRTDVSLTESDSGDELLFTSNGYKTTWKTNLAELDEATEYDLVLEAFDKDGQKRVYSHTFTTRTPLELPDQLSDELLGCAGPCITRAVVEPGDVPEEVTVSVNTNTLASIVVWISEDEPGWVDNTPILPVEAIVWDLASIRKDWTFQKNYLELDTNYHIVVKAYDDHGEQYQVGEFRTSPEPPVDVRVMFHQAYVRWDGDPHWGGLDRGEISLGWGLFEGPLDYTDTIGTRSEEKMDGGTTVLLTERNVAWRKLHEGEAFPRLGVTAMERDPKPYMTFGGPWPSIRLDPESDYPYTFNVAVGPALTIDGIRQLETCGQMGLDYVSADDYCLRLEMPDPGDDYARVSTIVSYHIDT